MKKFVALCLSFCLILSLAACAGETPNASTSGDKRSFTDSVGRTVELPKEIRGVIPSGNMALIFVYPLCADLLSAVADPLSPETLSILGAELGKLPAVGNLYKSGTTMNIEEVAALEADVFIDFGEAKDSIAEDLDALQAILGIPCVFISGTLENAADSYRLLGELLNRPEEAERCAAFIEGIMQTVHETFASTEKKGAVILNGTDGLGCVASGSFQDEIWAALLDNLAVTEEAQMYKSTGIDFEQLAAWDPEYLFFYNSPDPSTLVEASSWQELRSVKEGKVFKLPDVPWGYSYPPSVNRYVGILYITEKVYPAVFPWDAKALAQEFYQIFYHYELTEAELDALFA